MKLILVSIGIFQKYIKENINQLLKFNFDIHVIIDFQFFKEMDKYKSSIKLINSSTLQTDFDKKSKLDKKFRNGFWNNSSKRLFLVYEYMKMNNIENVIHIENDVLLYSNLNYNFEKKIYITMDSKNRCIPGIIYIPKYDLLTKLIENYDFKKNDMINLANFYNNNKNIVKTFPIINDSIDKCIYNENFKEFNSIFDGAAIGQYLGGVDPKNLAGDSTGFVNETCKIKYNKYKFKWMKKGNNYFPYVEINSKLIPINNLHIHCKKLEIFKMENPIENKYIKKQVNNFITGEKIQFSCDHFVGTDKDFRFNPNVSQYKNRFIYIGSNANINNKPLIFCYTHLLDNINKLVRTLEGLQNPFKLVLHNSDGSFNRKHLILFDKLPLLQCIYTQNMNVVHKKVFPLPIGLANSQWEHGNSKIHQEVYEIYVEKTKKIYFNFNKNTNKEKRNKCYNDIIKKGIKWNRNLPYKKYLIELKKHKYAICPEGNGIDTHRFWECLYMNTIPICLKNKLTEYYKKYFPIILLNDWQELNVNKISYFTIDHKYLDIEWIVEQIKLKIIDKINDNIKQYSLSHTDSKNEKLDLKLDKLFNYKRNGFFIELGANNGLNQSNTYFFENARNWTGILIEPSLTAYKKCVKNRPNSKCYNFACVSSDYENKYVIGDFNGSLMSSIDGKRNNSKKLCKVKAITLEKILDSLSIDSTISIDLLSLDTEGYELQILNGLNLKKYSPKYILIEIYKNNFTQIKNFLLSNGYILHSNFTNYNSKDNPHWDGTHNDYLFVFTGDTKKLFDIVIPVGPNDKLIIDKQIKYTKKNIIGYRNIYLICYDPTIIIDGCITINENIFPFNIETVAKYHGKIKRNGWYLQQLLKLYAGKIIPDILDKYLVIDSDTFFLKPTTFVKYNKCLYNYGTEYHEPYFHHMDKLDKGLIKVDKNKSGICHHMIFETKYIDELIAKIEKNHNGLFYNVFLKEVIDKSKSGASEYEIYFNYMLKYNRDKIQIRKLSWKNTNKLETYINLDYISYHHYLR